MKSSQSGWIESDRKFSYFKYSRHSLLIQWPKSKSTETLYEIINFTNEIRKTQLTGVLEIVSGYHSILVYFDPIKTNHEALILRVQELPCHGDPPKVSSEVFKIPVRYDATAPDLISVADHLGLSVNELIRLHSEPTYDVHFFGFLPGFVYLGGLHPKLNIPRRDTPRLRVPAGAVSIAAGQTGIYPVESPGGWHIIGITSVKLFDPYQHPPCPIEPGMKVKFEPI